MRRRPSFFGGDFSPREWPDRLNEPARARKPQVILVSFMGDLFDPGISVTFLAKVFAVMARAKDQTFLLLTRRVERMQRWLGDDLAPAPLPNVWLGTTVTDQPSADRVLPIILSTAAAHRWISYEPALGAVQSDWALGREITVTYEDREDAPEFVQDGIEGVVAGGESGPNRRPVPHDWFRSLRDQCAEAGVPYFLKQMGEHEDGTGRVIHAPYLDGKQHLELAWEVKR